MKAPTRFVACVSGFSEAVAEQRGKFAPNSNPSLEKRGKGRFGDAVAPELSANFWTRHQAKAKFREIFQ